MSPKILISIVNWNNYRDTINCIDRCKEIDYPDHEICVTDNNSSNDSCAQILAAHPDIKLIRLKKNAGYAAGHLQSYHVAKQNNYDALWILNPDTDFRKEVLKSLVAAWRSKGEAIFGSIVLDEHYEKIVFCGEHPLLPDHTVDFNSSSAERYKGKPASAAEWDLLPVDYVSGASFLLPLSVCEKTGFLRTDYFMYTEEVEYCYRARRHGIMSYIVKDAPVVHYYSKSFALSSSLHFVRTYYNTRNYLIFALDNHILTKKKIRADNHGSLRIVLSLIKSLFRYRLFKDHCYIESYFKMLGIFHALNGIKGKTVSPEKYL